MSGVLSIRSPLRSTFRYPCVDTLKHLKVSLIKINKMGVGSLTIRDYRKAFLLCQEISLRENVLGDNARESQKIRQSMRSNGHLPVLLIQATETNFDK